MFQFVNLMPKSTKKLLKRIGQLPMPAGYQSVMHSPIIKFNDPIGGPHENNAIRPTF